MNIDTFAKSYTKEELLGQAFIYAHATAPYQSGADTHELCCLTQIEKDKFYHDLGLLCEFIHNLFPE